MMESLTDYPTEELTASAPTHAAQHLASHNDIDTARAQACQAIAPVWSLDRAVAVDPHWAHIDMLVRRVAARVAAPGGIQVFPGHDRQLQAWMEGRISAQDLDQAIRQMPQAQACGLTAEDCVQALRNTQSVEQLPLLIDVPGNNPRRQTHLSWRQAITHQMSQTYATYFDQIQAD